nr:hypothetical protein [Tanacetum cinerariifolium]
MVFKEKRLGCYIKIDDEETVYDDEDDEVTKELYEDVNVNLGKKDADISDTDQGGENQQNVSQQSGFEQEEEDANKKQVDQYAQALSSIPAIVDHYMDNKLGEVINKAIQAYNFDYREDAQAKKKEYIELVDLKVRPRDEKRNLSKDVVSSRDSQSKEKKPSSTSKDASKSQNKSSSKSAHAEEPSHTIEDSGYTRMISGYWKGQYDYSISCLNSGQNQRDLPRDIPQDSVVVLRYEKRSKRKNKEKVLTEMELVLEQTQQGSSYKVSVSAEGVEVLKGKVKIKGEKKEALLVIR